MPFSADLASTTVLKNLSSIFCWRFTMACAMSRNGLSVTKVCSILDESHEARRRPKRNVGKEFTVDIAHHGPSTKWVVGISPTQHEMDMSRRFLKWTSKWPIFDHKKNWKRYLKNTLHPSFFTKPLFLIEIRKVLPVTGQLRKFRLDASGAIAPSSIGFSCKIGTDIWG